MYDVEAEILPPREKKQTIEWKLYEHIGPSFVGVNGKLVCISRGDLTDDEYKEYINHLSPWPVVELNDLSDKDFAQYAKMMMPLCMADCDGDTT